MKLKHKVAAFLISSFITNVAFADTANVVTKVREILLWDGAYGGCMVRATNSISDYGIDCRDGWISLDCEGVAGGSKQHAARMLDQANLAKLTEKNIAIRVTDTVKINGWCQGIAMQILK